MDGDLPSVRGYLLAGVLLCITIIGIPFGLAAFRIGDLCALALRLHRDRPPGRGRPAFVGNILWLILAGWWLALGHIFTGIALCITIIGIPLGIANFKLIPVSLVPFGKEIVPSDEAFRRGPG